jgi:hypothetical protein
MGAESARVAGFSRLEDGLRQAGPSYRWGPSVSERYWETVREDDNADARGLGLSAARSRQVACQPLGRHD